ncbi:MAG: FtsX-like permease family protein, partial [Campylobacterota bacterium]|nr:FtsX-like permease family protein [Campylobacterota bacterium]
MNKINLHLIEYAINSLLRDKVKNIFILIIMTLLIFLLSSVLFISNSIKYELNETVEQLPTLTIQKYRAGKVDDIELSRVDNILNIVGVEDVIPRVWGYYYFEYVNVTFSLVGIDNYATQYNENLSKLVENENKTAILDNEKMLIGEGVRKILDKNYYKEYFNFILNDGTIKKVDIGGVFKSSIELQSNDMILLSNDLIYEILDMEEEKATDIVVKVSNPEEIDTIVYKIKELYPDVRIISQEDFIVSYENIFNYKSGIFLTLFIISLVTFFMIVYDKASGLTSSQKQEVGVLKAIGWRVNDILKERFYESFIISFFSYSFGVLLSFYFVYILKAPILRDIFEGYSELKTSFNLPFVVDFQTLALIFFIIVP